MRDWPQNRVTLLWAGRHLFRMIGFNAELVSHESLTAAFNRRDTSLDRSTGDRQGRIHNADICSLAEFRRRYRRDLSPESGA